MFDEIALTERQGREFQILFVCREFENEFLNEIKVGVFDQPALTTKRFSMHKMVGIAATRLLLRSPSLMRLAVS